MRTDRVFEGNKTHSLTDQAEMSWKKNTLDQEKEEK